MTNRHGLPVLDHPTPRVREAETPVTLVLNRCANGCKRSGHFEFNGAQFCECCISSEIVRSVRL